MSLLSCFKGVLVLLLAATLFGAGLAQEETTDDSGSTSVFDDDRSMLVAKRSPSHRYADTETHADDPIKGYTTHGNDGRDQSGEDAGILRDARATKRHGHKRTHRGHKKHRGKPVSRKGNKHAQSDAAKHDNTLNTNAPKTPTTQHVVKAHQNKMYANKRRLHKPLHGKGRKRVRKGHKVARKQPKVNGNVARGKNHHGHKQLSHKHSMKKHPHLHQHAKHPRRGKHNHKHQHHGKRHLMKMKRLHKQHRHDHKLARERRLKANLLRLALKLRHQTKQLKHQEHKFPHVAAKTTMQPANATNPAIDEKLLQGIHQLNDELNVKSPSLEKLGNLTSVQTGPNTTATAVIMAPAGSGGASVVGVPVGGTNQPSASVTNKQSYRHHHKHHEKRVDVNLNVKNGEEDINKHWNIKKGAGEPVDHLSTAHGKHRVSSHRHSPTVAPVITDDNSENNLLSSDHHDVPALPVTNAGPVAAATPTRPQPQPQQQQQRRQDGTDVDFAINLQENNDEPVYIEGHDLKMASNPNDPASPVKELDINADVDDMGDATGAGDDDDDDEEDRL